VAAIGLYLLFFIVTRPVVAQIDGRHIVYMLQHFFLPPVMVLYLAATRFSSFVSVTPSCGCSACWPSSPSSGPT
jgi:hypothetical protein